MTPSNTVKALVATSLVVFLAGAWWFSERTGAWSEEVSIFPSGQSRSVAVGPDDTLHVRSCEGDPKLVSSSTRPELALCAANRTWPIMVSSYTAGWVYWPAAIAPYDVFSYRKFALVVGVMTLLFGFLWLRRFGDVPRAVAGVAAAAVTSAFVLPHGLLIHFELLPLPLIMLATWAIVTSGGGPHARYTRARVLVAGISVGLAVAINIKAVFILAGLALFAWPARSELFDRRPYTHITVLGVALAILPILPMFVFAAADTREGFGGQVSMRLANMAERFTSWDTLAEPLNLLLFWTDVSAYGDIAAGIDFSRSWWTEVMPALALVVCAHHLIARLRGRPHDVLAAGMGAMFVAYMLAAATLYVQRPAANYAPLHVLFGLATGSAAVQAGRWLAQKLGQGQPSRLLSGVLVVSLSLFAVAGLTYNTYKRGDPARLVLPTNAVAQKAAVDYLSTLPNRGTVATGTYNLHGILDAMSAGALQETHVSEAFAGCEELACYQYRWGLVSAMFPKLHVVLPTRGAVSQEREAALLVPALQGLADSGMAEVTRVADFSGVETGPLLALWTVTYRGEAMATPPRAAPADGN